MRNPPRRSPESEAIVERSVRLVLELHRPRVAAVFGFVNAKISRVIPNRLQVRNFIAHSPHAAKLEPFRSRHLSALPCRTALGSQQKRPVRSRRPHHLRIHRTHRNQQFRSPAILHRQLGKASLSKTQTSQDNHHRKHSKHTHGGSLQSLARTVPRTAEGGNSMPFEEFVISSHVRRGVGFDVVRRSPLPVCHLERSEG